MRNEIPQDDTRNFSFTEFCHWMPCGPTKARELIKEGKLEVVYLGRKIIVTPKARQDLIQRLEDARRLELEVA